MGFFKDSPISLIYNPMSGAGGHHFPFLQRLFGFRTRQDTFSDMSEVVARIQAFFESKGVLFHLSETQSKGHATALAKAAVQAGCKMVIVMGGDGTINEVVNGIFGSGCHLGIIPYGSSNVLALELGISNDVMAACEQIYNGTIKTIDVAQCNDRYFVSMAGIGIDAEVVSKVSQKLKKRYGTFAYIFQGVNLLIRHSFSPFVVSTPTTEKEAVAVVVCNSRYYGGNYIFSRSATITDGVLDVFLFSNKSIWAFLTYFFYLCLRRLEHAPGVTYFHCDQLEIRTPNHPYHLDAEYAGKTPLKITILAQAASIIC